MKNRKNVLIVFAILAILCLGIGYAALTDKLTLNGTINVNEVNFENENEFNVVWVSGTATPTPAEDSPEGRTEMTATAVASPANDVATLTVKNMSIMGDKVEATFTFKNLKMDAPKETYTAHVEVCDATGTAIDAKDLFDIKVVNSNNSKYFDLEKDGEATITITITLKKSYITPVEMNPVSSYKFDIIINASTQSN